MSQRRRLFGRSCRAVWWAALVCVSSGLLGGAEQPPDEGEPGDEVFSLPPILVEERLRPLRWRYLRAPGLEVLSLCDDAVTREFVRRIHRLEQVLQLLVPARLQGAFSVPEIQILFNEDLRRAKSQEVMEEMLSREREGVPAGRPPAASSSGLPPWQRRRWYFLPNLRLSDIDAAAIFAATRESDPNFIDFTFVPERVRYLLERRVPALPDWYVAGTLGLYERVQLRTDGIAVEPALWWSEAESKALAADENRPRTLWPMQRLLGHRALRGSGDDGELAQIWRAQCALFVRWAVVEDGGVRREALWKLVERLDREPLSESLFHECFGLGFSDVRDRLSDYLPVAVGQRVTLRAPRLTDPPELKPRAATVLEIARLRGEWERMQISYVRRRFPELTSKYVDQARMTLDNAYGSGERDAQLLAIIGLTECDAGEPARARAYLEAAARAGVERPRVYLELAKQRLAEQLAAAGEGAFSPGQVANILEPLRRARRLEPPLIEAAGILAETLSRAAEASAPEDLAWLTEAASKFPRASPLLLRAIYLNVTNGRRDDAIALAQAGLRGVAEAEHRARFERVLAQLAGAPRRE